MTIKLDRLRLRFRLSLRLGRVLLLVVTLKCLLTPSALIVSGRVGLLLLLP